MNKLVLLALLSSSLAASSSSAADRSLPPVPGPVPSFTMPVPTELTLKNGLKVFFLERHRAPLVDVVAVVGSGGLADPDGKEGAAVALADLLTQGATDKIGKERDAFAFDDAIKGIGASVDGGASWTALTLSLHVSSTRFAEGLSLFSDALLRPRLTVDDWERKRGEKLGELAYYKDEPRVLVGLAGSRALFGAARPGTALMGTPKSLTSTSAEDLRAFHRRAVRPDNAFLVVVGDLDKKTLTSTLESALSSWTAPAEPLSQTTPPEPAPLAKGAVVVVDRPGAPQSALQITAPVSTSLQPLDAPTAVMQTLLGGSFTSRLNTNLREEHGYSYGAGYSVSTRPWHKSQVSTSVASPVTIPALQEIFNELERIRTPATAEEVERARAYEALTFPAVLDGGRALAATWAAWKDRGLKNEAITSYMQRVLKVDVAAVHQAAEKLVDPTKVVVVVVGDKSKLEADLERWGAVKTLTADELLPAK
jgi:zinc protease